MSEVARNDADFLVETHSIDVIPHSARHGRPRDLFSLWFGANCQITIVLSGALAIFAGLSITWSIVGILVGVVLGGILMAFHSAQGPHLGLPQMIQSRAQFGYYGANLPLVIAVMMYLGFFAAGTVLGAQALTVLTSIPLEATIPIIGAGILGLTVLGYRAIHFFQKWLTIVGIIAFLGLTIAIIATSGDPAIASPSVIGDGAGFRTGPFLLVVAVNAVLLLSYGPYVADYSRYLPKNTSVRATFWYTLSAAVSACFWLLLLGAVLQNRYPDLGVIGQVEHVGQTWFGGFGTVMMVIIVLGIIGNNSLNLYGAFMSMATIGTSLTGRTARAGQAFRLAYIIPICLFGVYLAYLQKGNLLDSWQTLIGFLLYFLIPWTAVNLVDYYVLRKGRYDLDAFSQRDGVYGRWNAAGLIAYLVGCLAQLPFVATAAYHGPLARLVDDGDISWIVGTLVAGGMYYVLAPRLGNGMEIRRGDSDTVGSATQ